MDFERAAVTGGTGHLGNVLVRELLRRGKRVKALVVEGDDRRALAGLGVERVPGDVTAPASLAAAFAGAEVVFHLAGIVSITGGSRERLRRVNVEGTRNVAAACRAAGVRRLVYTSSVHALVELDRGGVLDERSGFAPVEARGDYGRSKAEASRVALAAGGEGLDVVLVLPTGVVGPYDYRLSEVGQLVRLYGEGRLRAGIAGAYDFVDVRDVAVGHVLAAEKGRPGESYLLNGSRISVAGMFAVLAEATGRPPPRLLLPLPAARLLALGAPLYERATGRRALLTPYAVHALGIDFAIDDAKARRELGHSSRPVAESLRDAWTWMRDDPQSPLHARVSVGPGRVVARPRPAVP